MNASPRGADVADFSLRILASLGTSAYLVYLVPRGDSTTIIAELTAELHTFDAGVRIAHTNPSPGAARLLRELPPMNADVLLISAESYLEEDWRLLDRRRSTLAREGVTVFITTPASFTHVMRVAPNLVSWLAGLVFSHESADAHATGQRELRLAALRAWGDKTDAEVVLAASEGRLPRDPEYAEWLVLLGRGDLLDGH